MTSAGEASNGSPTITPDKRADLVVAHYAALKEAAANVNTYRQQAVGILVAAFAPIAGSLIALSLKDTKTPGQAIRVAFELSLAVFALVTLALAAWSRQLERLHRRYRQSMDLLMEGTVKSWFRSLHDPGRDGNTVAAVDVEAAWENTRIRSATAATRALLSWALLMLSLLAAGSATYVGLSGLPGLGR